MILSAETGSGKTLAYLLPYLHHYLLDPSQRLIVIVPRKELVYQLERVLHSIAPEVTTALAISKWNGLERNEIPSVLVGTPQLSYEVWKGSSVH